MKTTIKYPKDAKSGRTTAFLKHNFQTPDEMSNLPNGLQNDIYEASMGVAYNDYERGRYLNARQVFSFLCCQRPTDPRPWMGIGICRQKTEEYQKAVWAFYNCIQLCEFDPRPHYQRGVCLMRLKKNDASAKALKSAIYWCRSIQKYAGIRARAEMLLKVLSLNKSKENKNDY